MFGSGVRPLRFEEALFEASAGWLAGAAGGALVDLSGSTLRQIREESAPRRGISGVVAQKVEIELSSAERTELERLARSETKPFREVQRARMILYSARGDTDAEIAERLDCTPECVGKWRRRFGEHRLAGLADRQRAGRPRRFPPAAGRRGQGARLRAAGHQRPAAVALHAH
ncbi:MAG: helix-turn-helix domain-containing protein [Nocardioidaceae bacterium]